MGYVSSMSVNFHLLSTYASKHSAFPPPPPSVYMKYRLSTDEISLPTDMSSQRHPFHILCLVKIFENSLFSVRIPLHTACIFLQHTFLGRVCLTLWRIPGPPLLRFLVFHFYTFIFPCFRQSLSPILYHFSHIDLWIFNLWGYKMWILLTFAV